MRGETDSSVFLASLARHLHGHEEACAVHDFWTAGAGVGYRWSSCGFPAFFEKYSHFHFIITLLTRSAAMDPLTEPFAGLCRALRGVRDQVEALAHVSASLDAFNSAFGDFQSAMALHASCLQFPIPSLSASSVGGKKVSLQLSGIPAPQAAGASTLLQRRSSRDSADSSGSLNATTKNRKSAGGGRTPPTSASASASTAGGSGFNQPTKSKAARAKAAGGQQAKKRRMPVAAKTFESPAWKWDKRKSKECGHVLYSQWQGSALTILAYVQRLVADIRDQIPRKYQSKEELKKLEIILLYIKNRQSGMCVSVWSVRC